MPLSQLPIRVDTGCLRAKNRQTCPENEGNIKIVDRSVNPQGENVNALFLSGHAAGDRSY